MARLIVIFLTLAFANCTAWAQNVGQGALAAKPSGNVAGKVDLVEGDVTVYDRAKAARKVRTGEALYEGEGVITGRDGELHVAMDDGGYLAVRPNTNMSILAYQAQGRDDDKSILNLVAGSFRSITGWIGRHNPRSYQVRTPTATIGVRGTDHEPLVIPVGAPDAEPGTYDKVNAGGTYIESSHGHGRVEVTPNRAGFAPLRGKPTPRLLSDVPRFYRPTRNEQRLFQKHLAVQKMAAGMREERKRVIEQRRQEINERKSEMYREQQQNRKDFEQRREPQKDDRKKWSQESTRDEQEVRRKESERWREQQQQERVQRPEDRRHKVEERRHKAEERKREREDREHAPRGRNRD
jgi:hypothetical protein